MAKTIAVCPSSVHNSSPMRETQFHDYQSDDSGSGSGITMRDSANGSLNQWSHVSRQNSICSSSTSSSSGCISERGSNISIPTVEQLVFELDLPFGTIKRKPSSVPKMPLTNTTRTIAMQSDDALLEVNSSSEDEDLANGFGPRHRGTLRNSTLRRSSTDDRLKTRIYEPVQRFQLMCNTNGYNNNNTIDDRKINDLSSVSPLSDDTLSNDESDCELPLPPPPEVLTNSLSMLSLNSLPPPPIEVINPPLTVLSNTQVFNKCPQSPPVPPKPKLFRRSSETAYDRIMNNRGTLTLQRGLSLNRKKYDMINKTVNCYGTTPRNKNGPVLSQNVASPTEAGLRFGETIPKQLNNHSLNYFETHHSPTNHCHNGVFYQCLPKHYPNQSQHQSQCQSLHHQQCQSMNHQNHNNQLVQQFMASQSIYGQSIYQKRPLNSHYSNGQSQVINANQYYQNAFPHYERPQELSIQSPSLQTPQSPGMGYPYQYPRTNGTYHDESVNSPIYTKTNDYESEKLRSPMRGSLPPPPETFIREIQRVMDKKWKVAQTLSHDTTATPSQILGFRDPAYLPVGQLSSVQPTQGHQGYHNQNMAPHVSHYGKKPVKSVRISSNVTEISNGNVKHNGNKKVPPPPPKRSESTQLSRMYDVRYHNS